MCKRISLILFIYCFLGSAFAAANKWTPIGPFGGGSSFNFAFDPVNPSIIYFGGFRSIDGGIRWQQMDFEPEIMKIQLKSPYTIFATNIILNVLFQSNDRGKTWQKVADLNLSPDLDEFDFEVHPDNPKILFIALTEFGRGGHFFKSTDGGLTWQEKKTGLDAPKIKAPQLEVDPQNGSNLFLLAAGGTYVSKNGGETWVFQKSGIQIHTWSNPHLVIDQDRPNTLYFNEQGHLYRSKTRAQSWEQLEDFGNIEAISISASGGIFLATGYSAFRSTDDGVSFVELPTINKTLAQVNSISVHPLRSNVVFVGANYHGVQRSLDSGNSWKISNRGLTGIYITQLSISTDGKKFLANGGKIWTSKDSGNSWNITNKAANQVLIHPIDSNLFVLENGNIEISADGGSTWHVILPGEFDETAYRVVLDPKNKNVIYSGIYFENETTNDPLGLIKTTDQGATWRKINNGLDPNRMDVESLVVSRFDSNILMAVIGRSIYRSINGGSNWEKVRSGSTARMVTEDPFDANSFYAQDDEGLLITTDKGNTWAKKNTSGFRLGKIIADPFLRGTLYSLNRSIFISTDRGTNWSVFDMRGLPLSYNDFLVSPTNQNTFYVPTTSIYSYTKSVVAGGPVIEQTFPNPVLAGGMLTILGRNFGNAAGTIKLGNNLLNPSSWKPNEIVVPLSDGLRTAQIQVTSNSKQSNRPEIIILPSSSEFLPEDGPSSGGTRVVFHWRDPKFHSGQILFGRTLARLIRSVTTLQPDESGVFFICTSPPGSGTVPILLDDVTFGNFTYR